MALDVEKGWDKCRRKTAFEWSLNPCEGDGELHDGVHCTCWHELDGEECCYCGNKDDPREDFEI